MSSTKHQVLELLERNRGRNVSGTLLAQQTGVTRNAIWKAIRELEKDGYRISAATNRGYCLREDNDILSVPGMLPHLARPEKAELILLYDSLESTNQTAKRLAADGAAHGTVVVANCQTAGRGRYDRTFFSPPGQGLYMSFILRPEKLRLDTPTLVTALAALTVCQALESLTDTTPQIKWVNDIYLRDKKIAGILTEAVTDFESGHMPWIVVGLGLNVTTRPPDFPPELRAAAGSIFPDGHPTVTRCHLAAEIINRLTTGEYPVTSALLAAYRARLLWLGRRIRVTSAHGSYEAQALDVDDAGRLLVRRDNGEIVTLLAGEITLRPSGNA